MAGRCSAFLFILLVSCSPRAEEPPAAAAPNPGKGAAGPAPTSNPQPARPFDESLLTGREYLWQTVPKGEFEIQDRSLGPLQPEGTVRVSVVQFFQDVVGQASLDQTLDPRWKDYLINWAASARAAGVKLESLRVGKALGEVRTTATLPLRVLTAQGEWRGWIALKQGDEHWLVSDIQMSLTSVPTGALDPEESQGSPLQP